MPAAATRPVGHVWVDGALLPADARHLSAFDRGFQLGDGVFETLRARGGRADRARRAPRAPAPLCGRPRHRAARRTRRSEDRRRHRDAARGGGPRRPGRRRLDPDHGQPRRDRRRAACCRRSTSTPTIVDPGVAGRRRRRRTTSSAACTSSQLRPARSGEPAVRLKTTSRADYVFARLEARRAGADDALFLTIDGQLSEATSANIFLVRGAAERGRSSRRPRSTARSCPGPRATWLLGWAARVGLAPVEGWLTPRRSGRRRRGVPVLERRRVLPVTRFEGRPIGTGCPVRGRSAPARPARHSSAASRAGPAMTRDELDPPDAPADRRGRAARRQPEPAGAAGLAPADRRAAGRGVGLDGPLPPRVAPGRQARGTRSVAGR